MACRFFGTFFVTTIFVTRFVTTMGPDFGGRPVVSSRAGRRFGGVSGGAVRGRVAARGRVRSRVVESAGRQRGPLCFPRVGAPGWVRCWVRIGFDRVFVFFGRELAAKLQEAVEIFDGAAMEALGLGLKAEECGGDVGLAGEAIEAEGEPVGAVLFEGDVDAFGEFGAIEDEWARRGRTWLGRGSW